MLLCAGSRMSSTCGRERQVDAGPVSRSWLVMKIREATQVGLMVGPDLSASQIHGALVGGGWSHCVPRASVITDVWQVDKQLG
jgi:hypothetical protein